MSSSQFTPRSFSFAEFEKFCAALCAWREARGEGQDGIRAVIHVIANRSKERGMNWAQIVYQSLQFSSMTYPHDPQLCAVPRPMDISFPNCYQLADLIYADRDEDLTMGATFYYATSIPPPEWAAGMIFTVQIGSQKFYREP
jgi:N-acetylmuramoyl-L-alanine amidase